MPTVATLSAERLELGTALSHLGDAAEDLRQIAAELRTVSEDHAMTTITFLRDTADGLAPSPAALLRSRGRVEALLQQLLDRADAEEVHLSELNIALLPNADGDDELERRALESFKERHRRGGAPVASTPNEPAPSAPPAEDPLPDER